ncbi:hypothetical protein [Terribacillus saccharophilus]|uniref:hypothetical protein n=1 Tax=Terribacillus saccharophilus TaxID=361277 RepID=UPI003D27E5CA
MIAHIIVFAVILDALLAVSIIGCNAAMRSIGADEPWRTRRKDNGTTDKSSDN